MIAVTLHTDDYRGDHAADVEIALDVPETTTLLELADILRRNQTRGCHGQHAAFITVRIAWNPDQDKDQPFK